MFSDILNGLNIWVYNIFAATQTQCMTALLKKNSPYLIPLSKSLEFDLKIGPLVNKLAI